jgi:crotonobetainyl-CoA:carnitine CoA-transferase CaiB-like acyl-CoA transferase
MSGSPWFSGITWEDVTPAALEEIRVVELGASLATAWCGRQFALWGADVVVLEPMQGSSLRGRAPHAPGKGGPSLLWTHVAAGKRALRQDVACPTLADLKALLSRADVLLADRDDPWLARQGCNAETLQADAPALVVVELSPFGRDGPLSAYAASEVVVQALAGYLSLNGHPDRAPLKAPGHILAYACGVSAFVGALAGLVGRAKRGRGCFVEVSEVDTIASFLPLLRGQYTGEHPRRTGGPGTGVRPQPCQDGFVSFMPPTTRQRREFEAALGVPPDAWPACARDGRAPGRAAKLMEFLAAFTRAAPAQAVFLALLREGIPAGIAARPDELLAEPHLAARGFFHEVADEALGVLRMPGAPAQLSATPAGGFAPAPEAPEPSRADPIGWPPRLDGAAPSPSGEPPLAGVRLLDLTQAWIGPYAAMLLADLGAETIKIESHRRPDVWRQWSWAPVALTSVNADEVNASPNYNSVNCNKRSLCLDLKSDAGREIFLKLAAEADLVMENYTPHVLEGFGLGYPVLRARNPRIVLASFCGYGKTGPLAEFKANGTTIEAVAAWDFFHRYPGGDPMVMGFYQADAITGLQMAATALVALVYRLRTGEGQAIDGSMYEAAAGYIGEALLDAQFGGQQTPFGNRDADYAPSGVFRCAGEDAWIALTVRNDDEWRRLTALAPELEEAAFADAQGRLSGQDLLESRIEAWTSGHDAFDLERRLQGARIPAGRVRALQDVLDCPHLSARAWFRRLAHADVGEHLYNGSPWRFAGLVPRNQLPSPRLGEHGREILTGRLGLAEAEIDALEASGVTGAVLAKAKTPEPARR